jgi:hydroxymethylglutaryl-CoA reductase
MSPGLLRALSQAACRSLSSGAVGALAAVRNVTGAVFPALGRDPAVKW